MTDRTEYGTLDEALKRWDDLLPCWSIEMGGMGPGYEQAIQVGVMELARRLRGLTFPISPTELRTMLEERLHATITEVGPALSGLSGAQAGAIMNLAYHFCQSGYSDTLNQVPGDRRILVSRNFPSI